MLGAKDFRGSTHVVIFSMWLERERDAERVLKERNAYLIIHSAHLVENTKSRACVIEQLCDLTDLTY